MRKVVDKVFIFLLDLSILCRLWITDLFCGNLGIGVEEDDFVGSPIEGEGVADFFVYEDLGEG